MSRLPEDSKFGDAFGNSSSTSAPVSDLNIKLENVELDTVGQYDETTSSYELSEPKVECQVEWMADARAPSPCKTRDEIRNMSRSGINDFAINQQYLAKNYQKIIEHQQRVIQEKNQLIQEKNQTIDEKNRTIQQQNQTIDEKNQTIDEKNQTIQQQNQTAQVKQVLAETQQQLIQSQERTILQLNSRIRHFESTAGPSNPQSYQNQSQNYPGNYSAQSGGNNALNYGG